VSLFHCWSLCVFKTHSDCTSSNELLVQWLVSLSILISKFIIASLHRSIMSDILFQFIKSIFFCECWSELILLCLIIPVIMSKVVGLSLDTSTSLINRNLRVALTIYVLCLYLRNVACIPWHEVSLILSWNRLKFVSCISELWIMASISICWVKRAATSDIGHESWFWEIELCLVNLLFCVAWCHGLSVVGGSVAI